MTIDIQSCPLGLVMWRCQIGSIIISSVAEAPSRPSQSEVPARWSRRKVKMWFLGPVSEKCLDPTTINIRKNESLSVWDVFFLGESWRPGHISSQRPLRSHLDSAKVLSMKVTSRKGAVLQEHSELEHTASWLATLPWTQKDILGKFSNTDWKQGSAKILDIFCRVISTLATLANLVPATSPGWCARLRHDLAHHFGSRAEHERRRTLPRGLAKLDLG